MEEQLAGLIAAIQGQQKLQMEQFNTMLGNLAKTSKTQPVATTTFVTILRL